MVRQHRESRDGVWRVRAFPPPVEILSALDDDLAKVVPDWTPGDAKAGNNEEAKAVVEQFRDKYLDPPASDDGKDSGDAQ